MKEFIEKLIGRLEEELKTAREIQTTQCIGHDGYGTPLQSKLGGEICALLKVQNIVNQLAEESSDYRVPLERGEWIPVSERFPEEGKAVLTCTKDGWISVNINMSYNGKKNDFECGYYTAWMPLPAPYQTKGE